MIVPGLQVSGDAQLRSGFGSIVTQVGRFGIKRSLDSPAPKAKVNLLILLYKTLTTVAHSLDISVSTSSRHFS